MSCTNKQNTSRSSNSLSNETLETKRRDSISNVRNRIEETDGNRILGNLYFGISEKEWDSESTVFYESIEEFKGHCRLGEFRLPMDAGNALSHNYEKTWSSYPYNRYEYVYSESPSENTGHYKSDCRTGASFYKDSLFNITISGYSHKIFEEEIFSGNKRAYVERLEQKANNNIKSAYMFLSKRYGPPDNAPASFSRELSTSYSRMDKKVVCEWTMERRKIEISLKKLVYDDDFIKAIKSNYHEIKPHISYNIEISITDMDMVKRMISEIHEEVIAYEKEEELQREESEKRLQEVFDNL